jgi:hypothetical protein
VAIDLSNLTFTNKADIVSDTDTIRNTGTTATLGGDDKITVNSSTGGDGIEFNNGTIDTGSGNDTIDATGRFYGINNSNLGGLFGGTIDTGSGNDTIVGNGFFTSPFLGGTGIANSGIIKTGTGNDTISGTGTGNSLSDTSGSYGIQNVYRGGGGTVTIDTGDGNDTISGTGGDIGIINFNASDITIDTGDGNDTISGKGGDLGIYNTGIVKTGQGNDIITGISIGEGTVNPFLGRAGISNGGTINTGAGNDTVDALTGGFSGTGNTMLEQGNDILKGFGTGYFDGGHGKDTLIFGTGSYTVSLGTNSGGFYTISSGGIDMLVKSFESIGSATFPADTFNFSSVIGGSFTI